MNVCRRRGSPRAVEDRELFLEHLESIAGRGERNAERLVFPAVPAGAEPDLDAAAAHGVGLRDLDRERTGKAERHRCHQGAEPDPRRLPADRGEGEPRVGRAGPEGPFADAQVVIGPEERVEPELLRELRDREQLLVGGALLRFGEDPQSHGRRR